MNKISAILFDIDGVILRRPYYFSEDLERRGYRNVVLTLNKYFNGHDHHHCCEGQSDTLTIITPYLKKFSWRGTAREYLRQQFDFERNFLDQELVLLIKKIKSFGIGCYLCSDQEKYRAEYILKEMDNIRGDLETIVKETQN